MEDVKLGPAGFNWVQPRHGGGHVRMIGAPCHGKQGGGIDSASKGIIEIHPGFPQVLGSVATRHRHQRTGFAGP